MDKKVYTCLADQALVFFFTIPEEADMPIPREEDMETEFKVISESR